MKIQSSVKTRQFTQKLPKLMMILLIISVVLGACTNTPTSTPMATSLPATDTASPTENLTDYSNLPFVGVTWYWLHNQNPDGSLVESGDPTRYSITFSPDGSYNGMADCNAIAGMYSATDTNLTINPGISTLMACPEGSQADLFLETLGKVSGYELQENNLSLLLQPDAGNMILSNQAVAPVSTDYSQTALAGTIWNWVRADYSDDTTVQVASPFSYAIQFLPDGTISGNADCNRIGGTYTLADSALTIEITQMTLMACPEGSLADEFVSRLNETATYVIQNGILYLNLKMDSGNLVFSPATVVAATPAQEGQPSGQITVNALIRNGPGDTFSVYGMLPAGSSVQISGKNQDAAWWTIGLPGEPLGIGWIKATDVTSTGAETVAVQPSAPLPTPISLTPPAQGGAQMSVLAPKYLRSGPGDQFPAIGVIASGAAASVTGNSADGLWWAIQTTINGNPVTGWVSTDLTNPSNVMNLQTLEAPVVPETVSPPVPPAGAASGTALTTINLRSGPGADFPVLGSIPGGSVLELTGVSSDGAWWQLRLPTTVSPDGFGWVFKEFIVAVNAANLPTASAPGTAVVITPTYSAPSGGATPGGGTSGSIRIGTTTEPVNIYDGPGKEYDSLGTLPVGTTGVIVDQSPDGKWVAFALPYSVTDEGKGWVSAAYVSIRVVNSATATAIAPTVIPPVKNTPTPAPESGSCKIIELVPASGAEFKPKADFDMKVVLKNVGDTDWDPSAIDIKFLSAVDDIKIHQGADLYDLPNLVETGDQITFYIDMLAPADAGSYGETWALVKGSTVLCKWSISIKVK